MPYRDELNALRARLEQAEAENARLKACIEGEGRVTSRPVDARFCSVAGGEPTTIRIENTSARKIAVFWLSYDGRERAVGTLVPGGVIAVQTYIGFCWRFVDGATGETLAHRRVKEAAERIVYDDES